MEKKLERGTEVFHTVTGEVGRVTWFQHALNDGRLLYIETMNNDGRFQMWPINTVEVLQLQVYVMHKGKHYGKSCSKCGFRIKIGKKFVIDIINTQLIYHAACYSPPWQKKS